MWIFRSETSNSWGPQLNLVIVTHLFFVLFTLLGIFRGYKRFYRRAQLESSDFVKDDTLKICCTVGVVVSAIHGPRLHYIRIPESNLGQQFGALLEDVENADVTFDVSGEKFHAHRVVLAARSPVFKSMFFGSSEEWNDKEISIEGTKPEVFKVSVHSF